MTKANAAAQAANPALANPAVLAGKASAPVCAVSQSASRVRPKAGARRMARPAAGREEASPLPHSEKTLQPAAPRSAVATPSRVWLWLKAALGQVAPYFMAPEEQENAGLPAVSQTPVHGSQSWRLADVAGAEVLAQALQRLATVREAHGVGQTVLVVFALSNMAAVEQKLGAAAGQALLAHVAGLVRQNIRAQDLMVQLRPGELVLLLANANLHMARGRMQALAGYVCSQPAGFEENWLWPKVTMACVVAAAPAAAPLQAMRQLVRAARQQLAVAPASAAAAPHFAGAHFGENMLAGL